MGKGLICNKLIICWEMSKLKSHIAKIVEKIRNKDIVLWIGAGFSVSSGLPKANELKDKLVYKFFSNNIEKFANNDLPSVVNMIIDSDENTEKNKEKLYDYLQSVFVLSDAKTDLQHLIREIPNIENIITTNYDILFELAYGNSLNVIYNNKTFLNADNNKTNEYKVHGDFRDRRTIVLSDEDYAKFLAGENTNFIWTRINDLIATKTIVFIGYSFSDINVLATFEKISGILGDCQKHHYLVSPNLEDYRIRYLERKNIHYINLSADQFTNEIGKEIKKTFISDFLENRIDLQKAIEVTKENGFIPEVQSQDGKLKISSIKKVGIGNEEIEGKITFKGDFKFYRELNEFISGEKFGRLDIPDGTIKKIITEYGGFMIDEATNITHFSIISQPGESSKGYLFYDESNMPIEVEVKLYSSPYLLMIEVINLFFTIVMKIRPSTNNTINITCDFESKTVLAAYEQFRQLNLLINSKKVFLSVVGKFERKLIIDTNELKREDRQGFCCAVAKGYSVFCALRDIQEYFGITFPEVENIPYEIIQQIRFIQNKIHGEKTTLNSSEIISYGSEKVLNIGDKIKLDDKFEIHIDNNQNLTFQILGYKFFCESVYLFKSCNFVVNDIIEKNNEIKYVYKKIKGKIEVKLKYNCEKSEAV